MSSSHRAFDSLWFYEYAYILFFSFIFSFMQSFKSMSIWRELPLEIWIIIINNHINSVVKIGTMKLSQQCFVKTWISLVPRQKKKKKKLCKHLSKNNSKGELVKHTYFEWGLPFTKKKKLKRIQENIFHCIYTKYRGYRGNQTNIETKSFGIEWLPSLRNQLGSAANLNQ